MYFVYFYNIMIYIVIFVRLLSTSDGPGLVGSQRTYMLY